MSTLLEKLRSKKRAWSEKRNTLNEENTNGSQSLVQKQDQHHTPATQPSDLWVRAEEKLRQNRELDKTLTESAKILESDYGLKLQPGATSHHKRLSDLLEERKWVIHLGNYSVGVGEQIANISKNVLALKDLITPAASLSSPASLACAGIIACFSVSPDLALSLYT